MAGATGRHEASLTSSPFARRLFLVLLLGDLGLIGADVLQRTGVLGATAWLVTTERGHAEYLQYAKFSTAAAALALGGVRFRSITIGLWAILFAFFAIDDAFAVHEIAGEWLSARVPLPRLAGARPAQVGEFVFTAGFGCIVLSSIAAALARSVGIVRQATAALSLVVFALMFFGVGVDLMHSIVRHSQMAAILAVLEDGGEMVTASVGVAVAVSVPSARVTDS